MCMIRLHRHIGAVARIGPGSDAEWVWAAAELGCCWPESETKQTCTCETGNMTLIVLYIASYQKNSYRSCSVPSARFSASGTGFGWESTRLEGRHVQPKRNSGGLHFR